MRLIRYSTYFGPPAAPSGLQPVLWLMPTASTVTGALVDYRGAGYNTITGSQPLVTTYPGGKRAWQLDGTLISVTGLNLNATNKLTILYLVSFVNYTANQTAFSYGAGSNTTAGSFDAYASTSGLFLLRSRSTDGVQVTGKSSQLNLAGAGNAGAFVVDYDLSTPFSGISPNDGSQSISPTTHTSGNWSSQTLYIGQTGAGTSKLVTGTLVRAALVFAGPVPLPKCAEWLYYLSTLP